MSTWPRIPFGADSATGIKANIQHLVNKILIRKVLKCMLKQAFLIRQARVFRSHIQANETRVYLLASNQPDKVRCVVGDKYPVAVDRESSVVPILRPLTANPRDVITNQSTGPSDRQQVGA